MGDLQRHLFLDEQPPLYQLFFAILVVAAVGMPLFSLLYLAGKLIFNANAGSLLDTTADTAINNAVFLKFNLVSGQISFFIIPAIIIMSVLNTSGKKFLTGFTRPGLNEAGLVVVLAFCIFPVTSFAGQLNSIMHLPGWLQGVEQWMIEKEAIADKALVIITSHGSLFTLMGNILIIAVLPAIGEELIFRGVLQKILTGFFKSGHPAVWITALIFSALHLQFFGFLPRFILGLTFGYLFFWSRTLWLPMISHFVNNAVSVVAEYIQNSGNNGDFTGQDPVKQLPGLLVPLIVITLIMLYIRKRSRIDLQDRINTPRGEGTE